MTDDVIFHLVPENEWKSGLNAGQYSPESLEEEGFIHCSTGDQVQKVANLHFREATGLMLIVIDRASLEPTLKYEASGEQEQEKYPHIYGPLNIDAIIDKIKLEPEEDGTFYIGFSSKE
ncbi:MAG: DUF952 domain-containing protein [Balneolaceae bacterium]|nr:DUF952 domain-containing protein [Balneolaceae bacterium]